MLISFTVSQLFFARLIKVSILSRRGFFCACGALTMHSVAQAQAPASPSGLSPDQALERLRQGNSQFRIDDPAQPENNSARRAAMIRGQQPFVAVLGCSDSRMPTETVFNAGVGEVFPTRVAGNSALPGMVGTLEYAVAVLRVPLIMVMGHENCGAVMAAKSVVEEGTALPGELGAMVAPIIPAVVQSMKAGGNDVVNNAARLHAQLTARWLRSNNRTIAGAIGTGALKVVASYYDIDEGSVTILPD
jgi:carbonic anhydrase